MAAANGGLSPAATDLGLGDLLSQQVQDETEEQRKKRMQQMQQQSGVGGGMASSPANLALFGGLGAIGS
jgi:hypothetical protein